MELSVSKSLHKRYYVKINVNCSLNVPATTAPGQEFLIRVLRGDLSSGPLAVRQSIIYCQILSSYLMRNLLAFPLLLCVVGAAIFVCGCTSEDAAPSASLSPEGSTFTSTALPTTVPTPDFIVVKKQETVPTLATSTLVISLYGISGWNSSSPLLQPGPGNEYVVVDFSLRNVGYPEGYAYRPDTVKLMDSARQQYTYHSASNSLVNAFRETTIPINETRRGRLVFEVPISPEGTQYSLMIG